MIFPAGGAVAFAGVFVAQASQLIAPTDAVAVAGFRRRFDGNKGHDRSQSTVSSSHYSHPIVKSQIKSAWELHHVRPTDVIILF